MRGVGVDLYRLDLLDLLDCAGRAACLRALCGKDKQGPLVTMVGTTTINIIYIAIIRPKASFAFGDSNVVLSFEYGRRDNTTHMLQLH